MSEQQPSASSPTPHELKMALKAFRKRLKLMRLDAESGLGGGPMSGGKTSSIVAITPPSQYPLAVWEELARQGKLRRTAYGTYELTEG